MDDDSRPTYYMAAWKREPWSFQSLSGKLRHFQVEALLHKKGGKLWPTFQHESLFCQTNNLTTQTEESDLMRETWRQRLECRKHHRPTLADDLKLSPIKKAWDSWLQGCGFEPHVGCWWLMDTDRLEFVDFCQCHPNHETLLQSKMGPIFGRVLWNC